MGEESQSLGVQMGVSDACLHNDTVAIMPERPSGGISHRIERNIDIAPPVFDPDVGDDCLFRTGHNGGRNAFCLIAASFLQTDDLGAAADSLSADSQIPSLHISDKIQIQPVDRAFGEILLLCGLHRETEILERYRLDADVPAILLLGTVFLFAASVVPEVVVPFAIGHSFIDG